MPRAMKVVIGVLIVAVVIGLISFRGLHRRMQRLAELQNSDEKARHEVLAPPISTPTDVTANAKIFWAAGSDRIAPVQVQLPLSADPVKRARQVIDALILQTPSSDQRTLPADATLLAFYILPDGTAIADFSDTLSTGTPSGIMSEQLAVDSIARTLEKNVSGLRRLKILIHGQEVDTLAGHVDLTGFFDLNSATQPVASLPSIPAAAPGAATKSAR